MSSSFEYNRWKLSSHILATDWVLFAASVCRASMFFRAAPSLPPSFSLFSMDEIMPAWFKFLICPLEFNVELSDCFPFEPVVAPTLVTMAPSAGELCLPVFEEVNWSWMLWWKGVRGVDYPLLLFKVLSLIFKWFSNLSSNLSEGCVLRPGADICCPTELFERTEDAWGFTNTSSKPSPAAGFSLALQ